MNVATRKTKRKQGIKNHKEPRKSSSEKQLEKYSKRLIKKYHIQNGVTLEELRSIYYKKVSNYLRNVKPATLGELAAPGIGNHHKQEGGKLSLKQFHGGAWLCDNDSGRSILRKTAAAATMCQIYADTRNYN